MIFRILDFYLCPIWSVLISWVLPALDVAYHHVSWLCLQEVGNVHTYFHLLVGIGPWRVVEHVCTLAGWCFRGIYKGGL